MSSEVDMSMSTISPMVVREGSCTTSISPRRRGEFDVVRRDEATCHTPWTATVYAGDVAQVWTHLRRAMAQLNLDSGPVAPAAVSLTDLLGSAGPHPEDMDDCGRGEERRR